MTQPSSTKTRTNLALTEAERLRAIELTKEKIHRLKLKSDLTYWATHAVSHFAPTVADPKPEAHHLLLLEKLQQVADGKINRLMIFMPPGTAKSTYTSKLFPIFLMAARPGCQVIGASNTSGLAEAFSREVQIGMQAFSNELGVRPLSDNKSQWSASNGSTYLAVGVGGAVAGFRSDFSIIDDPFKNAQEAYSEVVRSGVRRWYNMDLSSRSKNDESAIILMHTRWHVDDLAGQLLEEQHGDWTVLNLPAIWEEDEPEPSWPHGMGRTKGDLLWPAYHSRAFYDRHRRTMGDRDFAALYQQSPRVLDGNLIQTAKLKLCGVNTDKAIAQALDIWRCWDIASTAQMGGKNSDYTVGVLMQRNVTGGWTVLDVKRERVGPEGVEALIKSTAQEDGYGVKISLPIDPGSAGVIASSHLARVLAGYDVHLSRESGSKLTRATPFAAQINAGNVSIVKAAWNAEYLDELSTFPGGRHDDQVDASSRAFGQLIEPEPTGASFQIRSSGVWR